MLRKLTFMGAFLALFAARLVVAGNQWSFSIPSASSGSFTGSETTNSVTIGGDYVRQSNGFIKMTVTSSAGTNKPAIGTIRHGLEAPGFAFFSRPFLTNEKKIIGSVSVGVCPTYTWTGLMFFYVWTGTSGTVTDVSSASTPAMGVFSWDPFLASYG